ncbi:Carotenogenesis protein CarS [Myxococcus fulvus]|uniref:Carotenogenesis protein CarS n=1 Tax=Myxococcus TaxID=32 RepID=UPI0020C0262C|nr:Carotenogenesis protein CarS [Myxococcus fulvus]MCK8502256.1 Carotenogenesis protein CarS [Myxococcus fulvus]
MNDPSLIVSTNVDGAPVRIGERVKVVAHSSDGTISAGFLGHTGIVVALVYDDPVAQYPADPLIQVRVDGLGEDLFFMDELVPEWASAPLPRPPREKKAERPRPTVWRVQ